VAGKTTTVSVGQAILLTGQVPVQACVQLQKQQWAFTSPHGTAVGSAKETASSGFTLTAAPSNTTSSTYGTFYWVYPGTFSITYNYTLVNGGQSPTSTATFNVTGPGTTMTGTGYSGGLTIDNWTANTNCTFTAGNYLVYGKLTWSSTCVASGTVGMKFIPSGTSSTGKLFYVQLVDSGSLTGGLACTIVPGLDEAYPYPNLASGTNDAIDSPAVLLKSTYTTQSRTENFTMYLMYQSSTANSIPVPVGYQKWGFAGSASCSTSCGSAANWKATTTSSGTQGAFVVSAGSQANDGYPLWTSLVGCGS